MGITKPSGDRGPEFDRAFEEVARLVTDDGTLNISAIHPSVLENLIVGDLWPIVAPPEPQVVFETIEDFVRGHSNFLLLFGPERTVTGYPENHPIRQRLKMLVPTAYAYAYVRGGTTLVNTDDFNEPQWRVLYALYQLARLLVDVGDSRRLFDAMGYSSEGLPPPQRTFLVQ